MQTVVTHSGTYHSDDVFAVAALQLHLGVENVSIVRTRDEAVMATGDWVVDVGGVYDAATQRFDHHQAGAPVRENGIPYAAFGLLWRHLGEAIAGSAEVASAIEERLAQPVDAGDNGINLYTTNEYGVSPYELYLVLGSYKPVWGSDTSDDEAFFAAVEFARGLLERTIAHAQAGLKMRELAQAGYEAALDKRVLVFDEPVSRSAFIEYPEVQVIVYPGTAAEGERWNAKLIPKHHGTFETWVQFPAAWAGLRDDDLATASDIEDAVFCHKGRFMFVARTKAGAVAAAQQAQ